MNNPMICKSAVCACTLLAVVPYALNAAAYDDYVQLRVSDEGGVSSSFVDNDAGHWQKKDGDGTFVVEAEGPHPGEKYYVPSKNILMTPSGTGAAGNPFELEFEGDELAVAGRLWWVPQRSSTSADDATVTIGNLVLLPGGYIYIANGKSAALGGVCTVKGTSSNPSYWRVGKTGGNPLIHAALKGDSTSVFRFYSHDASFTGKLTYDGDASAFFGTLRVDAPLLQLIVRTPGGLDFPGTIELKNGATLNVPRGHTARIGNLVSDNGSVVLLNSDNSALARIVATNDVSASGGSIAINPGVFYVEAETRPLVTLTPDAPGTLSVDDFVLTNWTAAAATKLSDSPNALNLTLVVENGADGSRTLAASHRKIVYNNAAEGNASQSCFLPENASHWSDGGPISPENDYYVGVAKAAYTPSGTVVFDGGSLTVCGENELCFNASCNLTVADFRWVANDVVKNKIATWGSQFTVFGKVTVVEVPGGTFRIDGWNSSTFTIASELEGGGTLGLTSNAAASKDTRSFYALTGLNTNFAGRIHVFHDAFTGTNKDTFNQHPDEYCVTLTVSDSRNLGGPLKAFAADGILLANHSLLKATGSLTFSEPTRGWSICDVGRVEVTEGETLAITNTQITYAGEFRKEGAGTLKLGGTARFTEDALETPIAGTNVLAIAEGALMPADTTGCDGLAITFAAGTKLLLDASATGDLKTHGLYDVKWDTPITVADGAALPVAFALPEGFDSRTACRFGICTMNTTAAGTMDADDFAVKAPSGMKAVVSKVENRDSGDNVVSCTFACDLVPCGFIISVR